MKRLLIALVIIILTPGVVMAQYSNKPVGYPGVKSDGSSGLTVTGAVSATNFTSTAADGSRKITMTNNTSITPTASANELYVEGNVLKVNENGTEHTVSTSDRTETLTNKTITTPTITSLEVYIDCNGSADPYAYCTSANASTLTATHASRTIINSYGRGEAQTVTLPAAATGMTFIALVGTQHNSAWKIQRAGSDTITWSAAGTDTTGKTYFQETNQAVGSRVSCITYKSGAAAWSWLCGSVTGTWVTD